MKKSPVLVLASASPRRKELLAPFYSLIISPANADEKTKANESPQNYVRRVCDLKWKLSAEKWKLKIPHLIISADTIVVFKSKILGKPKNRKAAAQMLKQLSGQSHQVLSAVSVGWSSKLEPQKKILTRTKIQFRKLQPLELETYLFSQEWKDKAGAYAIQGKALSFSKSIVGSLTGVVGLPLEETLRAIEQVVAHHLQ